MADDLRIPWGYGSTYITLGEARSRLLAHYHPEFVRRLCAWLASKGGKVGIGGTWRAGGTQPDKPGFAEEGRSFHQNQAYNDGFVGACAVDLVYEDGPDANRNHDTIAWAKVPRQGSPEAARWGVHANVSSESWHMQPVEIDGWGSWKANGRPAPRKGYPIPGGAPSTPTPTTGTYTVLAGDSWYGIAAKLGMHVKVLLELNGATLANPPMMHPGDVLAVTSDAKPAPAPAEHPDPDTIDVPPATLRKGSTDASAVRWLQCILRVTIDGTFGDLTADAVAAVQRNLGQYVDGVYGPQTEQALRSWRASVGLPR